MPIPASIEMVMVNKMLNVNGLEACMVRAGEENNE